MRTLCMVRRWRLRNVPAQVRVTEYDLAHHLSNVLGLILGRRGPVGTLRNDQFNRLQDRVRIGTADYVAAAFDGLGTLGHVSDGHIRNSEDRAFFLYRSAVGHDGKSVLLEVNKVEKSERL